MALAGTGLPGTATAAAGGWRAQASGTGQALFAVSCFDALRCKAVGASGTLLYTKNGGAIWRTQANPFTNSSRILYRIACVEQSTCYVIARPDTVLVTHNGGVTWSSHRLAVSGVGTDLVDSACVSAQTYDIRSRPALCRLGLLDLACLSPSTCYVVGTIRVQNQLTGLGPTVFLTTDGGVTWKQQKIPPTAPCPGDCGPPGVRVPYPLEWISCGPGQLCRAGGSLFIGSHEGSASLVIKVGQPGSPWTQLAANVYGFGPAPSSAVCPTPARCYGVWTTDPFAAGNAIYFSTNGGLAWNSASSGSPKLRNAITCPGTTTCYSVGNQGTITVSLNGGAFVAQPSGTSHDLYGITCVRLSECFAVGNKGTIVARGAAGKLDG